MELKLGQIMRDWSTGFQGMATCKVVQLNGNVRFSLQPLATPGADKIADAMDIDLHTLEFVEGGMSHRVTEAVDSADFILGDTVEDIVSGFMGTAVDKLIFMNGCVYYTLVPRYDPHAAFKTPPSGTYFPVMRLKKWNDGVSAEIAKKKEKQSEKPPGGPTTKSVRL